MRFPGDGTIEREDKNGDLQVWPPPQLDPGVPGADKTGIWPPPATDPKYIAGLQHDLMEAQARIVELEQKLELETKKVSFWIETEKQHELEYRCLEEIASKAPEKLIRLDAERQALWEVIKLLVGAEADGPGETYGKSTENRGTTADRGAVGSREASSKPEKESSDHQKVPGHQS